MSDTLVKPTQLLDLPVELVGQILEAALFANGVRETVRLRLSCKLFDVEIVRAICHTNALDQPSTRPSKIDVRPRGGWVPVRPRQYSSREGLLCNDQRLLSQYLYTKTKTKTNADDCPPARLISDTVEYILHERPQERSRKDDFTRKLCEAAVAHTITKWYLAYADGSRRLPDLGYTTKGQRLELCNARVRGGLMESVLAACAHLQIMPLFHKLSKSHIRNRRTYFGWILEGAVASGDIEMTRIALQCPSGAADSVVVGVSMELAARRGYTRIVSLLMNSNHTCALKGDVYRAAIREAARHDHIDTLFVLLMTALTGRLVGLDWVLENADINSCCRRLPATSIESTHSLVASHVEERDQARRARRALAAIA